MRNGQKCSQSGVALVLSLLLLVIMTIVGVALLNGAVLQERMSSNNRLQTLAFEAASAGISEALTFGLNRANWEQESGQAIPCRRGFRNWQGPWGGASAEDDEEGWNIHLIGDGFRSEYRLIVYCEEQVDWANELIAEGFDRENLPPQLFVVSSGRVMTGDGTGVLSSRQIEVRVEDIAGFFGNVDPAIRIEGDPVAYSGAGGNFVVDGDGGPSIATDGADNRDLVRDAIKDQHLANYGGEEGIVNSVGNEPFDDPAKLRAWVNNIKEEIIGGSCEGNFVEGNALKGGNDPDCDTTDATSLDDLSHGWNSGALTYITGDLRVGPGSIADGSGVVIVEGNVCWHGVSSFQGKIIALGGLYKLSGGGGRDSPVGGQTEGSVFVADLDLNDGSAGWGESTLDVRGGGGHLVAYDCLADRAQWTLLKGCGLAEPWAEPQCLDDGGRAPGVGSRVVMTSWRENLGWREGRFLDE